MASKNRHIGFWVSLALFLVVVPYSLVEYFDDSIPFSSSLYILSGFSGLLVVINYSYLIRGKS